MNRDLAGARMSYDSVRLVETEAPEDPLVLFDQWLGDAFAEREAGRLLEPNAMILSTAVVEGQRVQPKSRTVLLKEFDGIGFTFYTNQESAKGVELGANPLGALCFYWASLFRQVRIEGSVEKVEREASEAYFAVRPRGSQLGAWASHQSEPVASAEALTEAYAAAEKRFDGVEVPCPPYWGGFRLLPELMEFWQGRPSRLHDRLVYRRTPERWDRVRLSP